MPLLIKLKSNMDKTKAVCFLFAFLFLASQAYAQDIENYAAVKKIGITLHIIELILAVFICTMSLKFFWITKPVNLFLMVYIALGFFIVNVLMYIFYYSSSMLGFRVSFVNAYIGSRISLIGMLVSLSMVFFSMHKSIRKQS